MSIRALGAKVHSWRRDSQGNETILIALMDTVFLKLDGRHCYARLSSFLLSLYLPSITRSGERGGIWVKSRPVFRACRGEAA